MSIESILSDAASKGASDIFIVAGLPLSYKINGVIQDSAAARLLPPDTQELIEGIYRLASDRDITTLIRKGDDDFSFALRGVSRFRVSTYKQRGSLAAVVRIIAFSLPDPKELSIPDAIIALADNTKGMILVTGPAGSGKSTTLACMIDHINKTQRKHIITLEDPLEFLHSHNMSIVSQREIATDTVSYLTALRAALRQSPDVILLGEMRDYETINTAMTAAETGHLIFSTLHTLGASNTIDRVIDVFPPNQQHQISIQLSMVLNAVVSQQLVPDIDGNLLPVFEIMEVNPAVRNMIREGKVHQIDGLINTAAADSGMLSMDSELLRLVKEGQISSKTGLLYAFNPELFKKRLP